MGHAEAVNSERRLTIRPTAVILWILKSVSHDKRDAYPTRQVQRLNRDRWRPPVLSIVLKRPFNS